MKKHKNNNPYVSIETCNLRTTEMRDGMKEIVNKLDILTNVVRGNPAIPEDMGLCGDIRDIKRYRKFLYSLLVLIGIPVLFLFLEFILKNL